MCRSAARRTRRSRALIGLRDNGCYDLKRGCHLRNWTFAFRALLGGALGVAGCRGSLALVDSTSGPSPDSGSNDTSCDAGCPPGSPGAASADGASGTLSAGSTSSESADGSSADAAVMVWQAPPAPVVPAISTGAFDTCVIEADHSVVCWGAYSVFDEDAGYSYTNPPFHPAVYPVAEPFVAGATSISVGQGVFCAALASGALYCWGPTGIAGGSYGLGAIKASEVVAISLGLNDSCALLTNGTVACGSWLDHDAGSSSFDYADDGGVIGLAGAVAVSAGGSQSCAVLASGGVDCWSSKGFLGPESPAAPVPGIDHATAVSVGNAHACALRSDGSVVCWGDNTFGQLGNGSTASSATPTQVHGLSGATAIAAGWSSTCAILADQTVRCWGDNSSGQLGLGAGDAGAGDAGAGAVIAGATLPVAVPGLTQVTAISVSGYSPSQACALRSDGTAVCWGSGAYGQLGNASTSDSPAPGGVVCQPSACTSVCATCVTCSSQCGTPGCCGTSCQTTHTTGRGSLAGGPIGAVPYYDCEPLGTLTHAQAASACSVWVAAMRQSHEVNVYSGACTDLTSSCGDAGSTSYVCSPQYEGAWNWYNTCWGYAGPGAGQVLVTLQLSQCPEFESTTDTWN
jgi:hypothetical protein